MRRLRNVVAATVLLIGLFFLFAHHQDKLPEAYRIPIPYGHSKNESSAALPEETPTSPNEGEFSNSPPQPEVVEPINFSPDEPSFPDVPLAETPLPTGDAPVVDDVLQLPPSSDLPLPTENGNSPPVFEAEYTFQNDLELDLPISTLKDLSNLPPHNYDPTGPRTNAYATFMATRNPSVKDPYYMAIHSLIYRILWSARSRTQKYPLVVFVADFVTPEQRQLLAGAGAVVRELAPLDWNPNVEGVQHRWKDLFAKLNMWNETEFAQILFLDADAFPTANIDAMFDMAQTQACVDAKLQPDDYLPDGSQVCEPYAFAGVPQNPFDEDNVNINVGSMVFTPSERMHQRLLQNYVKTDRYDCLMAEQAFLNWQFSVNGAFPARMLEREWGGFFPQENEEGKLKVVHEKIWSDERAWLRREWSTQWEEMLALYTGPEFVEQRRSDGAMF